MRGVCERTHTYIQITNDGASEVFFSYVVAVYSVMTVR
jgi:hypothetical protein